MANLQNNRELRFIEILTTAARLPGVRIDRKAYLSSSLKHFCSADQVEEAIQTAPANAGISSTDMDRIASDAIRLEAGRTTALSAAAGVPGAFAMVATIPLDLSQYLGHMLRVSQKLAYIYGWPELFGEDGSDPDDATMAILILFLGAMVGTQAANAAIGQVSTMMAKQIIKTLPRKALTKGTIFPIVKSVAKVLGIKMTVPIFAEQVSKLVPIVGAVASGGVTLATFLPMAHKLKSHLSQLELAASPASTAVVS